MKLEAIFEMIESRARDGISLTGIHLTLKDEGDLRRELLNDPKLLGETAAERLGQDEYYIRKLLATIGGIPVTWDAQSFRLV